MRSAPLPPIPSLVETSASTPYTPRTAHRHDARASVEQLVGLAGEQSRARQTVANRRGSVMGGIASRSWPAWGRPSWGRIASRAADLACHGRPRGASSPPTTGRPAWVLGRPSWGRIGRHQHVWPACHRRPRRASTPGGARPRRGLRQPPAGHLAAARPLVLGRADGGGAWERYSAALFSRNFFPDTARATVRARRRRRRSLWTDGAGSRPTRRLTSPSSSVPFAGPGRLLVFRKELVRTVGVELALLVVSRLTAFAMYVTLALVWSERWLSKCVHALHFVLERRVQGPHDPVRRAPRRGQEGARD